MGQTKSKILHFPSHYQTESEITLTPITFSICLNVFCWNENCETIFPFIPFKRLLRVINSCTSNPTNGALLICVFLVYLHTTFTYNPCHSSLNLAQKKYWKKTILPQMRERRKSSCTASKGIPHITKSYTTHERAQGDWSCEPKSDLSWFL